MSNNVVCVYAVKDIVAGSFSQLYCFANQAVAERWFDGLLKESKIASDLQLFVVGSFNVETGEFLPQCEFIRGGLSE